ncbi:MAG TPA: hypothetical protein VHB21_03775 [Minicystis sp.]|nr:hypothetical protein [Minicystis sp.]
MGDHEQITALQHDVDALDAKISTGAKYFNIDVPDYAAGASPSRDAYLRIGSTSGFTDPSQYGSTLWQQFELYLDESKTDPPHLRDRTGADQRPQLYGASDTAQNLWDNAGWRDHCDGNRITTTGGDKVEVIRGNYQLLVLGRAASGSADDGVIFDASGGHLVSGDTAPGMVTRIEYKQQKFGGTWKVTEETEKGHVHEIFGGEFKEEFRGSKKTSIVGNVPSSLTSTFAAEGTGDETGLPDLLDGTWARTITEYVGSSDSRVGAISSTTYAASITETTDVTGAVSGTTNAASITETTTAPTITETINATTITSNTYATTVYENVGKSGAHCATITEHWGDSKETTHGGKIDILLGGLLEVFVGGKLSVVAAKEVEIIGLAHTEVHAGSFREITLGYKWDLVVGWELEVDDYSTKIDAISKKSIAAAIFLG